MMETVTTAEPYPLDSNRYEAGESVISRPQGSLSLTHYTFLGWTVNAGPAVSTAGDTFTMPSTDTTLHAIWEQNGNVTIKITFDTPAYGAITFTSPSTIARGSALTFTTSLAGATGWTWYVDGIAVSTADPPFVWDTTGLQPGQYIIDAEATYNSHPCTGSMRVTVTY